MEKQINNLETLEEASERFIEGMKSTNPKGGIISFLYMAVSFGAAWQAKRSYSKEQLIEQLNLLYSMKNSTVDTFTDENDYITDKWFNQDGR